MTITEIIQLCASFVGSLCFGILFNIREKKLLAVAVGGLLSCAIYLFLSEFIPNEAINYFIVAMVVSVFSEIMARVLKTPATPITITALIPLIPGSALYYTMAYAFQSDFAKFVEKAIATLSLAAALALGIIIVTALFRLFSGKRK